MRGKRERERERERERDHRHFFADTNLKPCFAGGDRRRRKKILEALSQKDQIKIEDKILPGVFQYETSIMYTYTPFFEGKQQISQKYID